MAWFGDGLSSLSNLKGQITSFTKEVLSEGIVEESDERTRQLNEANEKCVQLQEILNTKDAEISLLRRQNCELQKAVVELNAKPRDPNDSNSLGDDGGGGFFWDPPPAKNREALKNPDRSAILQERLSQASLRIRELEEELKLFKSNDTKDEITDGHQKAELLRAKQDMVNRIIQIGEKSRDAERNLKKLPLDETALINDFRAAISKLDSHEQSSMVRSALKALDLQYENSSFNEGFEKSDADEKGGKYARPRLESISLVSHSDDSESHNGIAENDNAITNMEIEQLRKKIQELQQENEFLTRSLDELDKEHSQSLDTILAVKDQLSKKHESLQKAYEQLYVECNDAQTKLQLLESKAAAAAVEANNKSNAKKALNKTDEVSNEEKGVQTEQSSSETNQANVQTIAIKNEDKDIQTELEDVKTDDKDNQSNLEDLTRRVNDILKNSHIEVQDGETIFESLANQFVEANWKKEMLERKLTEISRELKQTAEMKDSLQMECDDMQTNIESLLMQIEHLKSNLPSIPEASEERVASLETETESMGEEIKRLQAEHEALKVKHFELITTVSVLEGSLRNQENLEAEVRNTKQQLDIAKQQLDGASKNVENNENMMEDLSRRLHASLEENNQLRKRIDALEIAERQAQEQLRAKDDKCKDSEENVKIIERVQKEIEDMTKELKEARSNAQRLENELSIAVEARNELERDISAISDEKEHLETELMLLRESENKKENGDLLKSLREQLEAADREKNDLEYDILNMRKELDKALEQITTMENEMSRLVFDNEKLEKENHEFLDQLESSHDDSMERIELLQTEMTLLTQEHSTLKQEVAVNKNELLKVREELKEALEKRQQLESELAATMTKFEALNSNSKVLESAEKKALEEEVHRLKSLENQLSHVNEKCQLLEAELTDLRSIEQESMLIKNKYDALEAELRNLRSIEQESMLIKNKYQSLETELTNLRSKEQESIQTSNKLQALEAELTNLRSKEQESMQISNKLQALEAELTNLRSKERELTLIKNQYQSLEAELTNLRSGEQERKLLKDKYQSLEAELMNLRTLEQDAKLLRDKCQSLEVREQEAQILEAKFKETESKCRELEALLAGLQSSRSEQQISTEDNSRIIAELTESRKQLESSLESAKENAAMAKETIESLSQLVKEKDQEIESLKLTATSNADKKHSEEENALAALKAEREEFVRLVQEKHNTSLQYYAEIQRLAQLLTEQTATLQQVTAERDEKASKLAEKDTEIHWAQNELQVVRQRLKALEESQNYGETCGIVEHSVQIAQAAILNEKCNALEAALIQEQSSNRIIQNQLTESQLRETNAARELERLRTHLVEIEASYTEEALIAEENRKQLEAKLLQAEEKMQNTSTVYTSASIRANQQVETLQQQMALIVQQRDEIQSKLSAAEDKVLSHTASLTNLQIVLEQFQRDKENDIRAATEKIRQQLNMSYKEQEDLRNDIVSLRMQLSEAKECLQAASRLSEQLDKKSERIEELNQEVARLTELVNTAEERIQEARSSEEGKVDKNLVKNLLIGFLSSSTTDKSSVLRVFSTILEFDETERERAGLNHPAANSGWFSGLLGSGGATPTKDQEASLSAAFVRFLESESKPKAQLPALTISNSPLGRPGHSRQHSSSSTQSGLLLSSVTLPSFPDFVPSRNTGSILKEVLKDS